MASDKEYFSGRSAGLHERRAALYLRVSPPEQRLDLQQDALAAYAERADLEIVARFADVAVSGRHQGPATACRPDACGAPTRDRLRVSFWRALAGLSGQMSAALMRAFSPAVLRWRGATSVASTIWPAIGR